jgi:hypothetical protein
MRTLLSYLLCGIQHPDVRLPIDFDHAEGAAFFVRPVYAVERKTSWRQMAMGALPLRVLVRMPSGDTLIIHARYGSSIYAVKRDISARTGVPLFLIQLAHRGLVLPDSKLVEHAGLHQASVIHADIRSGCHCEGRHVLPAGHLARLESAHTPGGFMGRHFSPPLVLDTTGSGRDLSGENYAAREGGQGHVVFGLGEGIHGVETRFNQPTPGDLQRVEVIQIFVELPERYVVRRQGASLGESDRQYLQLIPDAWAPTRTAWAERRATAGRMAEAAGYVAPEAMAPPLPSQVRRRNTMTPGTPPIVPGLNTTRRNWTRTWSGHMGPLL